LADGSRIPKVVADPSALRSLPLSAADGFVLSRIDGRTTERELANLTGLPPAQIEASLDKLLSLKVIDVIGGAAARPAPRQAPPAAPPPAAPAPPGKDQARPPSTPAPRRPSSPANAAVAGAGSSHPPTSTTPSRVEAAMAAIPDNTPELSEDVDLPPDLRRRVLALSAVIASVDHYGLLGVPRDADKKAIKRAYFEMAAVLHPDRYFRKQLGSFKPKMEQVFAKVSTSYETLADKALRAEYDQYLIDVSKAQSIETVLRNVMDEVATAEQSAIDLAAHPPSELPPEAEPAPAAAAKHPSGMYSAVSPRAVMAKSESRASAGPSPPHADPPGAAVRPAPLGAFTAPPGQGTLTPPAATNTRVSDQLRREALAMRLKGMTRPPAKMPTEEPAPPPHVARAPGAESDPLRRRYDERLEASRSHQGEKYLKQAHDAESKSDLTSAAAAYRVALTFIRSDHPEYAHAQSVIEKSATALGEMYLRQADHEERSGRLEEAARSWARAAKLRPDDARAQERYANALVKVAGDMREAGQYAKKAVALAPTNPDYRCTLVNVYAAAGLALNARREAEAAAAEFPASPAVQQLLKRIPKPT
jgi:curved DNA-binding protein CbpA